MMETMIIDNRTGEIVTVDDAWERRQRVIALRIHLEETFLELARELVQVFEGTDWEDGKLNCGSFQAYLADPEVDISYRTAMQLMEVYERYIITLSLGRVPLLTAGYPKLYTMIPYITEQNADELVALAGTLTRKDLKIRLEEMFPAPPPLPLPEGQYRVIYADPPWQYGNTMPEYFTEQADHYDLMTLEAICALPVKELVADDAVLFLWVTSPILEEAFQVVHAWGFEYKTSFVWDKVKHCMGHYNSVRHELLLVCVRGSCQPDEKTLFDSVVTEERPARHSQKPEVFRKFIDTLYPIGPRIELFARTAAKGWDVWGNEVP